MRASMCMLGSRPLCVGLVACLCLALLTCQAPEPEPADGRPRLLLVVVVDQLRADYLDRFDSLWTAGMRRLLDEGAVFTEAHHRHAVTHTASGHASLITGCHPRRHGIISNWWSDPDQLERVYAVDDPEHDVSPVNLLEPSPVSAWRC